MAASGDEAQEARKRAHWVSLRTLQRVPNFLGETEQGEPIVEVGAARLVLPQGANNFYHLSPCANCGRETVSDAVLTTAHLSNRRPVYCRTCTSTRRPAPPDENTDGIEPIGDAEPARAPSAEPPEEAPASAAPPPTAPGGDPGPSGPVRAGDPGPSGPVRAGNAVPPSFDDPPGEASPQERWQRLVTEVSQGVAARLQRDQTQFVAQLADAVSGALEQHRQALARDVTEGLARQLDVDLAQVGSALTGLEPKLRGLEDAVAGRLDEGLMEVMAQLETALGTMPENPRRVLASEVAEVAAERVNEQVVGAAARLTEALTTSHAEVLARVEAVLGERLTEERRAAASAGADTVATRVEDGVQAAILVLGERIEEQYRALITDAAGWFEEQRRVLAADVGERLDQQRQVSSAEGAELSQQFSRDLLAMAAAIEDRFNNGLQLAATTLQTRSDEGMARLAAALEARFNDGVTRLASGLDRRFDDGLRGLELRLVNRLDERQADIVNRFQDLLSTTRELVGQPMSEKTAASFLAVRDDLYDRLDRVAEEAAKSGMNAARVLLRATEEHVLATSGALAARVAELEAELANARASMEDLRRSVDRMARRIPAEKRPTPTRPRAKKATG